VRTTPQPDHDLESAARLESILLRSPVLQPIFSQWSAISLPDCWLAAGAVAQTVWNDAFGFAPAHGLSDIDLVYFDGTDLSELGEARSAERLQHLFAGLPMRIDAKNEARMHLWYAAKFGHAIPPYTSTAHAITTFPTTATAVGVQPKPSGLSISAPFGLADLLGLVVRPNKVQITRSVYEAKATRWRSLWPRLAIVDWSDA
jgi:hypothetical protein